MYVYYAMRRANSGYFTAFTVLKFSLTETPILYETVSFTL
jgi:hypothetical protein